MRVTDVTKRGLNTLAGFPLREIRIQTQFHGQYVHDLLRKIRRGEGPVFIKSLPYHVRFHSSRVVVLDRGTTRYVIVRGSWNQLKRD